MKRAFIAFMICFMCIMQVSAQNDWFWQNPIPQGNALFDIQIIDTETVVAVGGSGTVIKTTNNGTTWTQVHHTGEVLEDLRALSFINTQIGYCAGSNGRILKTEDGGSTWENLRSNTENTLYDIQFASASTGWCAGAEGVILKNSK